jgi:hypothetical protein
MNRWLWPLFILVICLPVLLLATGMRLPGFSPAVVKARPLPLPLGDQELAWIHTTTNATTWERFVSGWMRAPITIPGLKVDDSAAFQDSTTAVPEIVVSREGYTGKLRIRWYKIRSDVTARDWIEALSERDPPPIAIVGGGSTDRAVDLAQALQNQEQWKGERPLLLITTATADKIATAEDPPGALPQRRLIDLYPGRSFRFCFTNRQMAEAVLDFVWDQPDLRPLMLANLAPWSVASTVWAGLPGNGGSRAFRPQVLSVLWDDDPYSTDLHRQFTEATRDLMGGPDRVTFSQWHIPYSVGGFLRANLYEARTAESLVRLIREVPEQRMLLVLPAVTQPARRMLRAIAQASPLTAQRLVVVTGDGIPINTMYRDGEFAWPTGIIDIPVVLFTHNHPLGWDDESRTDLPQGYELRPPNSTEEALHFRDLGRIVSEACFPSIPTGEGIVDRAEVLKERLQGRRPAFFDDAGERRGGTGEFVVVLQPRQRLEGIDQTGSLSAYRRNADRSWTRMRTVAVTPRGIGSGGAP